MAHSLAGALQSGALHDHLKEYDIEGDRFDFEEAAQYVSSLLKPHCLSNFFSASTLLEVNKTNDYKLRFKSTDKNSAGEEASNACKILSGLDPKCSLRLTLLVAPENLSGKQQSGGAVAADRLSFYSAYCSTTCQRANGAWNTACQSCTALSEKIREFKTNVQKLVENPTVEGVNIRYAATVSVDPMENKEVPLAQITCDHKDFEELKKRVDGSSNLWSVVLH